MGANAASVLPGRQPLKQVNLDCICTFLQYKRFWRLSMTGPRLLEQYRERLRVKHYSLRTEEAYLHWVRRFIYFHGKRHPRELGGSEVETFLSHLASAGRVAASTQNQALAALLFLYREVLGKELPRMDGIVRAKRPARVWYSPKTRCGRCSPVLTAHAGSPPACCMRPA